jgi:ACR3 family arsenite efflux pump ArsB
LYVLVALFGGLRLAGVRRGLRNVRMLGASLGVNFLWNLLLGVALGAVFLAGEPDLRLGLLMLFVTPCTDWYLLFTGVADGDVELAATLLPYNLVLQLALLPVYVLLFAGTVAGVDLAVFVEGLALVLGVPLAAVAVGWLAVRRSNRAERAYRRVEPALSDAQVLALTAAVAAMVASQADLVVSRPGVLALVAVPVVAFYAVNVVVALGLARALSFDHGETACLACTTLSRNSPTALAIAVATFPDRPLVALALVVGPLVEVPLLSVVSRVLLAARDRGLTGPTPV